MRLVGFKGFRVQGLGGNKGISYIVNTRSLVLGFWGTCFKKMSPSCSKVQYKVCSHVKPLGYVPCLFLPRFRGMSQGYKENRRFGDQICLEI